MKQFTMSMFTNKEDLYKAKSEYLQYQLDNVLFALLEVKPFTMEDESGIDWYLVDTVNELLTYETGKEYRAVEEVTDLPTIVKGLYLKEI